MLVASHGSQGTEELVAFVGSWAAAVKAERTEARDKTGSAPPATSACSAAHRAPAAGERSARRSESKCIRDLPGRSP